MKLHTKLQVFLMGTIFKDYMAMGCDLKPVQKCCLVMTGVIFISIHLFNARHKKTTLATCCNLTK